MNARLIAAVALASVVAASAGCGGKRESPLVRKANALCQREDPKIAEAENYAPGIFTANDMRHIETEVNGLAKLGLLVTLSDSFVDWGRAQALIMRSSDIRDLRKADTWLRRARIAAAAKGIHCSFGAQKG